MGFGLAELGDQPVELLVEFAPGVALQLGDLLGGGECLAGFRHLLGSAFDGGFGRIVLGDTTWRVTGPELPAGERVRIIGVDGATLKVEAA